jgi:hypothetical protein
LLLKSIIEKTLPVWRIHVRVCAVSQTISASRVQQERNRQLAWLSGLALTVFAATFAFFGIPLPPEGVHALLAAGVFPLILAAMAYFTPTLTHSGAPSRMVGVIPLLALLSGALAVFGLALGVELLLTAALLGLAVTLAFLAWLYRRAARAIGGPYPGVYWYAAALVFLVLGFAAMTAGLLLPEHGAVLKRLHLHFNLLGFVGLTVLGTLPVLLPTAGGYADAGARGRLRSGLKYAVGGTVSIALGAAWYPPASVAGLALWLVPVARLAHALFVHRKTALTMHNAASALGAALFGFALALIEGAGHALGVTDPRASLVLFFIAFLFPLVSGAASYLLPLWLRPAATAAEHAALRAVLVYGSGIRALGFVVFGLAAAAGIAPAAYGAVALLAAFLLQVVFGVWRARG